MDLVGDRESGWRNTAAWGRARGRRQRGKEAETLAIKWVRLPGAFTQSFTRIDASNLEAATATWGRKNQSRGGEEGGVVWGPLVSGEESGGRRRVGFRGWSGEVMAAWDFEWRKGTMGGSEA